MSKTQRKRGFGNGAAFCDKQITCAGAIPAGRSTNGILPIECRS